MSNNNSIPLAQERHGGGPVSIFPNELTGCGRAPDPIIRTEIVEVPVIQPVELDASWISPLERTHLIIQAKPVTGDLLNGYLECSAIVERADADRAAIRAVEGRNDG